MATSLHCIVPDCTQLCFRRGLCRAHYRRYIRLTPGGRKRLEKKWQMPPPRRLDVSYLFPGKKPEAPE